MSNQSHNDQAVPETSSVADKIINCLAAFQEREKKNEETFIKNFSELFAVFKEARGKLDEVVMF